MKEQDIEYIKHYKYMTQEERVYLMSVRDKALKNGITFANHAVARMDERWIKEKDVIKAIRQGQIMEYKKTNNDEILTIRGTTISRKNEQIFVILSIKTGKVITTYSNKYWIAINKSSELDKYTNDRKIQIPDFFKKQYALFY
jgi:hypothetical protein